MTENQIELYLLKRQPCMIVNGTTQDIPPQSLKLVSYLADTGETAHVRDELIRLLYGSVNADERFRKKALFPLRKLIPDALPRTKSGEFVHFKPEGIWVDSRVFAQKTNALLQEYPAFNKRNYLLAQKILELYIDHFMEGFQSKAEDSTEDRQFHAWRQSRRRELASLYHQLLDQMITFCLKQERYWGEARFYAERWLNSINVTARPLQYLIWLAAYQPNDTLNFHLEALREREMSGERPTGPTWAEWNKLLKDNKSVPLSLLFPKASESTPKKITAPTPEPFERRDIRDKLLTTLGALREGNPFALTGMPGVGKTAITRAVIAILRERSPEYKIAEVELTPKFDFEIFCNNLLSELGRQDLFELDYGTKRQRLRQLLRMPNLIVAVDEGHSTHFADAKMLDAVLDMLSGSRVMLVARELAPFDYYVIELPGLDEHQTQSFLLQQVPWLQQTGETSFNELADLTYGLPLILHIIAGGLRNQRGRLSTLIERLKGESYLPGVERDIFSAYKSTLAWIWQYLDSQEINLLFAISLFAPEEGVELEALSAILTKKFPGNFSYSLGRLVDMHLVERRTFSLSSERYTLHPIILDFVQGKLAQNQSPYISLIERAYVRYILDFIQQHLDQADQLDQHQQNIFRMFDLILMTENHSWAREEAIKSLNQLYPYFERRGLYARASKWFAHVHQNFELPDVALRNQTLFHMGKIAHLEARYDQAIELFEAALAESMHSPQLLGALYLGIGGVYMFKGEFDTAIQNYLLAEQYAHTEKQMTVLCAIWSNLGVSSFYQNRIDAAQEWYQKVEQVLGDDLDNLPTDLKIIAQHNQNALGVTLTELGQFEAAKLRFKRGMELARQTQYPELEGQLYLNLGVTYYLMADYAAAHHCFVQGGIVANEIQHIVLHTDIMWNQGALASAQFLHHEAFRLLYAALSEAEDNDLKWLKPRMLIALGKAYLRTGSREAASQCFLEALTVESITIKHIIQAFYGLGLCAMLNATSTGSRNGEEALAIIHPVLQTVEASSKRLHRLSRKDVERHLTQADVAFCRDLTHLPQIPRYCIAEGIILWLYDPPVQQ